MRPVVTVLDSLGDGSDVERQPSDRGPAGEVWMSGRRCWWPGPWGRGRREEELGVLEAEQTELDDTVDEGEKRAMELTPKGPNGGAEVGASWGLALRKH